MLPISQAVLISVTSGILGGIVGPIVTWWFQKLYWRRQKRSDVRFQIVQNAALALAKSVSDAFNSELQTHKKPFGHTSLVRAQETRPETFDLLENSRSLVKTFFSEKTSDAFDLAVRSDIKPSFQNTEFYKAQADFMRGAATELGIIDVSAGR